MKSASVRMVAVTSLAVAVGLVLPAAQALTIADPGAVNASVYTTGSNNDLGLPDGAVQTVSVGYSLSAEGPGTLLYTYIGKEAGYTNSVTFSILPGGCSFSTNTAVLGASCGDSTGGGSLVFSFASSGTPLTVANGNDFSFSSAVVFGRE